MKQFVLFLLFLTTTSSFDALAQIRKPVWVDTDLSIGKFLKEIDDGYALIYALHSPELEVLGISTVFGNTDDLDHQVRVGREIVQKFAQPEDRKKIKVYRGATSKVPEPAGVSSETDASEALLSGLQSQPLTILAFGPLTNIATVVKNHPEVVSNIREVVLMGGRRFENPAPVGRYGWILPDKNINDDVEAVKALLESAVPLTLIPLELARQITLEQKDLEQIKTTSQSGEWLAIRSEFWLSFWQKFLGGPGFLPFDTLVVGYAAVPEQIECMNQVPARLKMLQDDTYLPLSPTKKKFLVVSPHLRAGKKVKYCHKLNPEFKRTLLERL